MSDNFEASIIRRLFDEIKVGVYAEIKPRMLEAMEAAFDQAWDAAMRRLAQSPQGGSGSESGNGSRTPVAHGEQGTPRTRRPNNVATRAVWGTSNALIEKAFEASPTTGLTPKDIADFGAQIGVNVAASSVRSTLQRMQHDSELRRRKNKYYKIKVAEPKDPEPQNEEAHTGATVHTIKGAAA